MSQTMTAPTSLALKEGRGVPVSEGHLQKLLKEKIAVLGEALYRLKIAVVSGGWSDEREISLSSGKACCEALKEAGFKQVELLDIAETSELKRLLDKEFDLAFMAMHGRFGEDGCMQGFLEIAKLPYTFSDVTASSVSADKQRSKAVYKERSISSPVSFEIFSEAELDDPKISQKIEALGLPLFVKPSCNGSSYGISRVNKDEELIPALEFALSEGGAALIEQAVKGTEITVAVLGNRELVALPPIEIIVRGEMYGLDEKYEDPRDHHICPARLSEQVVRKAQEYAAQAHMQLGCSGASRSDFIVDENGEPYILETNTIPGMTETSLLPDAARAAGLSFPELCSYLVVLALEAQQLKNMGNYKAE